MTVAVISPHLDDAVLSFGAVIGTGNRPTTIVTVFAGMPPSWSWPTPFDNASGFDDSVAAVVARRAEDRAACLAFRARVRAHHMPWLDGQYGRPQPYESIVQSLTVRMRRAQVVVAPLGLAHPDHRLVAKACRAALRTIEPVQVLVYADLPAAKLWPSHVPGAMRGWERAGFPLRPYDPARNYDMKKGAVECYTSQLRFPELAWENLTEEQTWIVV